MKGTGLFLRAHLAPLTDLSSFLRPSCLSVHGPKNEEDELCVKQLIKPSGSVTVHLFISPVN